MDALRNTPFYFLLITPWNCPTYNWALSITLSAFLFRVGDFLGIVYLLFVGVASYARCVGLNFCSMLLGLVYLEFVMFCLLDVAWNATWGVKFGGTSILHLNGSLWSQSYLKDLLGWTPHPPTKRFSKLHCYTCISCEYFKVVSIAPSINNKNYFIYYQISDIDINYHKKDVFGEILRSKSHIRLFSTISEEFSGKIFRSKLALIILKLI